MKNVLLVGLGGFVGSAFRYLISLYALKSFPGPLPLGTLFVNLVGSFLIGLLAGLMVKSNYEPLQLVLLTGFCGGFTTFSTFSLEGLKMLESYRYLYYGGYVGLSVVGGLALCFLGFFLAQKMTGFQ